MSNWLGPWTYVDLRPCNNFSLIVICFTFNFFVRLKYYGGLIVGVQLVCLACAHIVDVIDYPS